MTVRRHYIETSDVSGSTEANIALAEELIDRYVGPQPKWLRSEYRGQISSIINSNKTFTDSHSPNSLELTDGYYARGVLEMLSGLAAGQRQVIESSSKDGKSVTLRAALTITPAVGDYFKIYQLAKFPRRQDVLGTPDGLAYYASIPEAVREACVAQVAFIVAQGDDFFNGGGADMQSESFLNYSYTRKNDSGSSSLSSLISPQARALLRGITNRRGRLIVGGGPYVNN